MMANRRLPHGWRQFCALDAAERWLVIEAFMLMAIIQVGFRTMPFAMLRRWLDKAKGCRGAAHTQARIAWAVNAAGRRLPGRTCLSEALAADVMLRRRGYTSSVRFGIRKIRGSSDPPQAHAWVECGGTIVTGQLPMMDDYKLLY